MNLWIMRHGEAEPYNQSDATRALTARGYEQARLTAEWLSGSAMSPLRIIASPYTRAQQTALKVAEVLGVDHIETLEIITPDDEPKAVCEWLDAQSDSRPILLVSHMPLVGALTAWLTQGHFSGSGFNLAEVRALEMELPFASMANCIARFSPSI